MKQPTAKRRITTPDCPGFASVLPEIRSLIDASRQYVVSTANLTLVWLYWNVGRLITRDIQANQKRAGYGKHLIEELSARLTKEYGRGFSAPGLRDMERFFDGFEILQPADGEITSSLILSTASRESPDSGFRPRWPAERHQPTFSRHRRENQRRTPVHCQ